MSEARARAEPSTAILTVPNLLTFLRLALTPLFLWVALGPDRIDLALGVAVLGLVSDLVDGKIARRFGQVSKLGIALDPLSDRLGLAAGAAVLIVHDLAPLWVLAAVLARDGALLVAAAVLKARGVAIPAVSATGKIGSFTISVAFGLFLASGAPGVADPVAALRWAGIAASVLGIPLYYAAGWGYAREGVASLRRLEAAR